MAVAVLDVGSRIVKAGASGALFPAKTFSNAIYTRELDSGWTGNSQDVWIGAAEQTKRGVFSQSCPMADSVIEDWEQMERVWEHTFFSELRLPPDEAAAVLLTQPCENPQSTLEKTVAIMFEQFSVPNLHMPVAAVLSLYSAGCSTGLAVDVGHGSTSIVPVFNGNGLATASRRICLGGAQLNQQLAQLVAAKGAELCRWQDIDTVKHEGCSCASDYDSELTALRDGRIVPKTFQLTDGQSISLDVEQVSVGELLFQPHLAPAVIADHDIAGLPQTASACVSKCAKQLQKGLAANVVLSGGGTLMQGFVDRMFHATSQIFPLGAVKGVGLKPEQREFAAWVGGSILGSLSTFEKLWISMKEYEDHGDAIMHRLAG